MRRIAVILAALFCIKTGSIYAAPKKAELNEELKENRQEQKQLDQQIKK